MNFMRFSVRHGLAAALAIGGILLAQPAYAYRPFDFTDADTLAAGQIQLKAGPVNATATDAGASTVAPSWSASYGLAPGWELTAAGKVGVPLGDANEGLQVAGLELAAKTILREGSLHGGDGPSLATEVTALLPGPSGADPGLGANALAVASWRLGEAAVHVNALGELTRGGAIEGKTGLILDGPESWIVRPALEGGMTAGLGSWKGLPAPQLGSVPIEYFCLVGGIWKLNGDLSLDLAGRLAWSGSGRSTTVRGGFAWKL